jgi:HEAT repeat protein
LKDGNPVTRGDAAYTLGVIGSKDTIPFLREITNDENVNVSDIAKEAIEEINENVQSL